MTEELIHLNKFHEFKNPSGSGTMAAIYSTITLPKTGKSKANIIAKIIVNIRPIAISLPSKKLRLGSTLYALLNDFVIALNPFEADHNVPRILIDNKLPLRLFITWVKFWSIIWTTSPGKYSANTSMTSRSSIGK